MYESVNIRSEGGKSLHDLFRIHHGMLMEAVLEGRFVLAVERRIGRRVERRFDRVVRIVKAQMRVQVRVWGQLRVRPEQALQGFAGACAADCFF